MFKKYSFLLLATSLCLGAANAQTKKPAAKNASAKKGYPAKPIDKSGFTKGVDDLDYKFIKHGTGTVTPQLGDAVEIYYSQMIGDSVLFNSYQRTGGKPQPVLCQPSAMKGDLMDGIKMMKVGDSVLFRMQFDTLLTRAKQPRPDWVKPNAYFYSGVKLVSIKPKAVVDSEQAKAQAEQAKMQEQSAAQSKVQAETDDKLLQEYFTANNIKNAKKTASGLYYVVTKTGEGANATAGQKATVNYTGRNIKGETFDSNVDSTFNHVSPFEFNLGQHQVISGWDEGVALMNKGEKATFYIPSGMAYGPRARAEKIPENAILIFDIELVDMK